MWLGYDLCFCRHSRRVLAARGTADAPALLFLCLVFDGYGWTASQPAGKIALTQAPDEQNKKTLEGYVKTLSEGKPIEQ